VNDRGRSGFRSILCDLLDWVEASESLDGFLRQFPTVTREQAIAVLEAAKRDAIGQSTPA
jgi:hypothetical protein